jgi:rhamnulokinase
MTSGARTVVAVDLGAESGRVVLCRFDGQRVALQEVHRFPNGTVERDGHLRWDVDRLWSEIADGLRRAGGHADRLDGVGVATWGIDYGLLDREGALIDQPVSHRDPRTEGRIAHAAGRVGRDRLYDDTGTQLLECNTIYQLMADVEEGRLASATRLLMIPDLFHRRLAGSDVAEFTPSPPPAPTTWRTAGGPPACSTTSASRRISSPRWPGRARTSARCSAMPSTTGRTGGPA